MNLKRTSPVPPWSVLSIAGILLVAIYVTAQRMLTMSPKWHTESPRTTISQVHAAAKQTNTSIHPVPSSLSKTSPDLEDSFVILPLQIVISYPRSNGVPRLIHGGHGSACDYELTFDNLDYIAVCAFSLETVGAFQGNNTAGEWHVDVDEWNRDRQELETMPIGTRCSHSSIYGCSIIGLKNGMKALAFYDYRPDTKAYLIYRNGYLIEFTFDVYDAFFNAYQSTIDPAGIAPWIEKLEAPQHVLDEVEIFRKLVNSVSYYRR